MPGLQLPPPPLSCCCSARSSSPPHRLSGGSSSNWFCVTGNFLVDNTHNSRSPKREGGEANELSPCELFSALSPGAGSMSVCEQRLRFRCQAANQETVGCLIQESLGGLGVVGSTRAENRAAHCGKDKRGPNKKKVHFEPRWHGGDDE